MSGMARGRVAAKVFPVSTFIKDWREHLGLRQGDVSARLMTEYGISLSVSHLSRIERGEKPYNQRLLEALANIMQLTPGELLTLRPGAASPEPLLKLWVSLEVNDQSRLLQMVQLAFGKAPPG